MVIDQLADRPSGMAILGKLFASHVFRSFLLAGTMRTKEVDLGV
jgi:hypothetical protein